MDKHPDERVAKIIDLGRKIASQQGKFDRGDYKTYGGAASLQQMRTERKALLGAAPPFRLLPGGKK
jgi:hypothetical protein